MSDFSAGHDPTIAGTGQVIGSDVSTFVNEFVDGGAVTIYDATGTPSNMQLRWAKTDSVANGGTDTWKLFYQVDSNATGTTVAWQNVGTDFQVRRDRPAQPAGHQPGAHRRHHQRPLARQHHVNMPSGSVTQFANASGATTVNNLQQNGFPAGQLQSISVGNNGRDHRHLLQRPERLPGGNYVGALQRRQRSEEHRRRRLPGRPTCPAPAIDGASGKMSASRWKAPTPTSPTEFTKLIVTQQAYSANTKVITTANQMSQDLLNMLR